MKKYLSGRRGRFRRRGWSTGWLALLVALLLAVAGIGLTARLRAINHSQSLEAESGQSGGYAARCEAPAASGGALIRFGRTSCVDTPVPADQLFGWGSISEGVFGYWHRLLRLPDGSWLRVQTVFPTPTRDELMISRSTDHARTWTKLSQINDGERRMDNGFLHIAPNGDLILGGRSVVPGSSSKIVQYRSLDKGTTWVREADLDSGRDVPRGVWEPHYFNVANNRMVVHWSDQTYDCCSQVLVQKTSDDSGKTWSQNETVIAQDPGPDSGAGMSQVARMANGEYIMAMEMCGKYKCAIHYKKSPDGTTWPPGVGTAIPGQYCGPFIMALSDGRVVVSSCRRTPTETADKTHPVSYSDDYGATWKVNTPAFTDGPMDGYWVSMYQTGPNELAFVSGSRIRFGTFVPRQ